MLASWLLIGLLLVPGIASAVCEHAMDSCRYVFPLGISVPTGTGPSCQFGPVPPLGNPLLCSISPAVNYTGLLLQPTSTSYASQLFAALDATGDSGVIVDMNTSAVSQFWVKGGTNGYTSLRVSAGNNQADTSVFFEDNLGTDRFIWNESGGLVLTGRQPASVGTGSGTDGIDSIAATAAKGGNTTDASGDIGGTGGDFIFTAGAGGNAPGGSTNGTGGSIVLAAGAPGVGAGTPGIPGNVSIGGVGGQLHLDGRTRYPENIVNLTADNQVVTPTRSVVQLSSDNVTATNRTFTIPVDASGAILYLVWMDATDRGELVDTGTARLSATWSPDQFDTLTLLSDGTNWVELARAAN